MSTTRLAAGGADFSEHVGKAVYQSAANTVDLWSDPTVEPFGVIRYVDEADPSQLTIATHGDPCKLRVAAGGIAAGVGLVTTVGAGGKVTAPSAGDFCVAMSLHRAAAAEDALVEGVVNVCQLSIAGT